jgi:hypothetical protein
MVVLLRQTVLSLRVEESIREGFIHKPNTIKDTNPLPFMLVREKRYQDVFARNIGKGFLRQIPNLL